MANPPDELEGLKAQVAALTARIYTLEQRLGVSAPAAAPPPRPTAQAPVAPTPVPQRPVAPAATPMRPIPPPPSLSSALGITGAAAAPQKDDVSLEKRIGQVWLNRIGIAAVLIGVAFFLQWAFQNHLIGPTGRVAMGLVAGIGLVVWSERFRRKNYVPFSYSLKAVGIGALYLSLWAASQS